MCHLVAATLLHRHSCCCLSRFPGQLRHVLALESASGTGHTPHSLSSPLSPVALSLSPQQMQMSLSCVIRGKRSLTSPWSALPAYLSQQQQQISTFFFGGNFLSIASLLFYLHLKQNPHRPCPCPRPGSVAQRVTRTYRLFIDNRVGGHL